MGSSRVSAGRTRSMTRHRSRDRRPRQWAQLDLFGLHRRKREAIRRLGESVHQLEHLVALLNQLAAGIFADDEADDLASGVSMLKTTVKGVIESGIEIAARPGEVRFMSHLASITVEEPDEEEPENEEEADVNEPSREGR